MARISPTNTACDLAELTYREIRGRVLVHRKEHTPDDIVQLGAALVTLGEPKTYGPYVARALLAEWRAHPERYLSFSEAAASNLTKES